MATSTVENGIDSNLAMLSGRLRAALSRAFWDRALLAIAIGIAAALVAYATLRAGDRLVNGIELTTTTIWWSMAAAGVAASVIAVLVLFATRPTTADLARRADLQFVLGERLSTALQLAGQSPRQISVVGRALMRDADRRAADVNPRALVRFRWDRIVLVLLGALAFASVALTLQPGLDTLEDENAAAPATLSAAEQAETASDLRRIADALTADADTRDDAFINAIAREVEQLGAQVEAGDIPDRELLVAELDRLAELAADAYERADVQAGATQDLSRLLDATRQNVASPDQFMPEVGNNALLGPENAPPQTEGATPPAEGGPLDDMLADTEARQAADEAARQQTPRAGQPGEGVIGDYYEAARADAAARANERRAANQQQLEGAQLAGPAQNSNRGEGLIAGQGEQPLEGEIVETSPFETLGELLLEDELDGEGRRIKIDVPPEAEDIRLDAGDIVAGDWQRFEETDVLRSAYPLADRDILARYFRGLAEAVE